MNNFEENSKESQFENDDDDEEWKPRKNYNSNTLFSKDDLHILKRCFNENPSPDHEELDKIANEIGMIINLNFLRNYFYDFINLFRSFL